MKAFYLAMFIASVVCGWSLLKVESYEKDRLRIAEILDLANWRDPAAIGQQLGFAPQHSALKKINHKRVLAEMKLEKQGESIDISLGHFLVTSGKSGWNKGSDQFLCGYYDKVLLEFVGEGMAESGHLPTLKVEGNCEVSTDVRRIKKIKVPFAKIQKIPASQLQQFFFEKENIFVTVDHASYALPRNWDLKSVKMFHQLHEERVFKVEPSIEERKRMASALRMDW